MIVVVVVVARRCHCCGCNMFVAVAGPITSDKLIAELKIGHANAPSFDNVCVCVCVCVLCWSGRHVL